MDKICSFLWILGGISGQTQIEYVTKIVNSASVCNTVSNFTLNSYQALNFLSTANPPLAGNTNCEFRIEGPSGSQFLIHFIDITLPTDSADYSDPNHCDENVNYITLTSGGAEEIQPFQWSSTHSVNYTYLGLAEAQKICGVTSFQQYLPEPIITANNIIIVTVTTGNNAIADFNMMISPINSNVALNNQVTCNGQRLDAQVGGLLCDNHPNCYDETDELNKSYICPSVVDKGLSAGMIALYVIIGIIGGILLAVLGYFVYRKVREYFLLKELRAMEEKIMFDEGITDPDDAEELKHDIFDLM